MKIKSTLLILGAAMLFASCSQEKGVVSSDKISIDASINSLTRVSGAVFENGDKISLYAYETGKPSGALIVNNVLNTYNGATWTAATPMTWKDKTTRHDFLAIYPNRAINPNIAEIFDMTDAVSTNDILVATAPNLLAAGGAVRLQFDHIMSKVSVNLTFNAELVNPTVTKVVLRCQKKAQINYLTKAVVSSGPVEEMILSLVNGNYVCVASPQTIEAEVAMIEVYLGADPVPYAYKPKQAITLNPKQSNQFNLKVGGSKKIEIRDPVSIGDWTGA